MIDRLQESYRSLAFLLLVSASSCTSLTQTQQGTYSENLAKHRKTFKVTTRNDSKVAQHWDKDKYVPNASLQAVTEQLDYLLERKKLANQQIKHIAGYTIQVYAGGSREAAFKARNKLYKYYPHLQPEVKYDLPNYTVRVGKFLDKLELYSIYTAIKRKMPQAIIRPISLANTPYVLGRNQPARE